MLKRNCLTFFFYPHLSFCCNIIILLGTTRFGSLKPMHVFPHLGEQYITFLIFKIPDAIFMKLCKYYFLKIVDDKGFLVVFI